MKDLRVQGMQNRNLQQLSSVYDLTQIVKIMQDIFSALENFAKAIEYQMYI